MPFPRFLTHYSNILPERLHTLIFSGCALAVAHVSSRAKQSLTNKRKRKVREVRSDICGFRSLYWYAVLTNLT